MKVPKDGIYQFFIRTENGEPGKVVVHDRVMSEVLGNKSANGFIGLKAGLHPVTVLFCRGNFSGPLEVTWRKPKDSDWVRESIPADALFHSP